VQFVESQPTFRRTFTGLLVLYPRSILNVVAGGICSDCCALKGKAVCAELLDTLLMQRDLYSGDHLFESGLERQLASDFCCWFSFRDSVCTVATLTYPSQSCLRAVARKHTVLEH
jgi:hypothetical protein